MGITIIYFAVEVFTTILERIFCESTLVKRENKKAAELCLWIGYFAILNLTTHAITSAAWVNMLVFLTAFFVTIRMLYANPARTLIAVTVFLYLSGMCAELIVFYGKELLSWNPEPDSEILLVVISRILWFIILKLVSLLVKMNKKRELNTQDWLEVFIVPTGSIWILLSLFTQGMSNAPFLNFMAVAMVLIINISTYYLYDKAKETMEKRMREEILIQQCDYYIRQHKESREWWEELGHFRHDMKQHYLLEKAYLEAGDYDALERYCSENLDFLNRKSTVSNTGNIYVDSIINYKAAVAEKQNIEFIVNLNIPEDVEVNAEDLSISLGNLLDNAIEATAELTNDKIINIEIKADGNNLFLSIRNKYSKARHKVGGRYLTSKENTKKHGLGLIIVQQIIEKYEGELSINEADNEFEVVVLLYNFLK